MNNKYNSNDTIDITNKIGLSREKIKSTIKDLRRGRLVINTISPSDNITHIMYDAGYHTALDRLEVLLDLREI